MKQGGLRAVLLRERAALLRLLSHRVGPDEAEELLQELWLKLDRAPSGPIAEPVAYLFRMAHNLALDRRRAALRRALRETHWQTAQPSEGPSLELGLIARERLAHVEAALAALPDRVGQVFRLYRLEGLPQKAIAEQIGTSLSTVEKLLHRAYRAIHDMGRAELTAASPPHRQGSGKEQR